MSSSVPGTASALQTSGLHSTMKRQIEHQEKGRPLRIHFYLGPVVRTEIVYQKMMKNAEEE